MTKLGDLSNDELIARLRAHVGRGNVWLVGLLGYLGEVDARRLYAEHACTSIWDFCVRKLGMSDGEANRRIAAARVLRRFPVARGYLERGAIHLCAIYEIHKHLTEDNHEELLREACGKSTKDVARMIAARFPKPDVHACVEPLAPQVALPASVATSMPEMPEMSSSPPAPPVATALAPMPAAVASRMPPRPRVEPLSAARYRVELTVSAETNAKLERIKDLMRHRNPTGDLEKIVDASLDLLLVKLEKQRLGKTSRPKVRRSSSTAVEALVDGARPETSKGACSTSDDADEDAARRDASPPKETEDAGTHQHVQARSLVAGTTLATSGSAPADPMPNGHAPVCATSMMDANTARAKRASHGNEPPKANQANSTDQASHGNEPPKANQANSTDQAGHGNEPPKANQANSTDQAGHGNEPPKANQANRADQTISARKAKAGKRRPRRTGRAHIPRAVVREVFARDGEQCTYVDAEGNRCPARGFLELDHIRAKARGGGDDAMNLRARCRLHNRWHAEQVFGREYIEERIHLRRRTYAPPASPAEAQPPSPAGAQPPSPAVAPPTSPAVAQPPSPAVAPPTSPAVAQPPSPAVAQPTSPAVAQPTSPAVAQSSTAETPPVVVPSSFDTVARALRSLGFREPEVRAAMTRLRTMLDPALPNETILREALRLLT